MLNTKEMLLPFRLIFYAKLKYVFKINLIKSLDNIVNDLNESAFVSPPPLCRCRTGTSIKVDGGWTAK